MESIKELFKIGNGPSSSHTMGPARAALKFLEKNPSANNFVVTLYGSLAATGKGHLTDEIILRTLGRNRTKIILPYSVDFRTLLTMLNHPNPPIATPIREKIRENFNTPA